MKSDRRSDRVKRRVTCELAVGGRRHRGIVLDLSETGVFVQTEGAPAPGSRLQLRFHGPDGAAFEVEASVARRQVAPPQLASVVRGGLGLRVHAPPPAYFELIGASASDAAASAARAAARAGAAASPGPTPVAGTRPAARTAAPAPPASSGGPAAPKPAPPAGDLFRVRVKQIDGNRSRTLEVRAASPEDAAKRALADLGRGWEVLRVDRG